ncbi:LysE family translocator [Sulfurospirillum diekertiae]|uniref:Leucine efflux protein n=1 Tax=Sulfurospirillum diekertiae TaxID=1854492 RepID=A0A1Y0HP15_9BACT|nr:LysE family translocator [Sulfurospirillum diekertiae]ARU49114.1 Leucine efflux protein [Sulfurospirillum diekertiae]ASC93925.1 Leucine efflux protein [Sulfurospirillum diekertiae]
MFDIQNYYSFIAAILVFQLIPGAGTIAILNATARNGIQAGLGAVFGTLLGDFAFMIAALAGLAAIMQQNPFLFEILQYFGAGYLCWLGIGLLRSKIEPETGKVEPKKSALIYFKQAFFVSITNPKVMLFFVAFFPLFLRPDASSVTLGAMILHVSLISLVYQTLLVLLGNTLAHKLKTFPLARKIATRLAGIALIAFGIKLASNNR